MEEVVSALGANHLRHLQRRFEKVQERYNRGVSQLEFLSFFLDLLKGNDSLQGTPSESSLKQSSDVVALFNRIDVCGGGFVRWGTFTSYCVEAGLRLTASSNPPLQFEYVEKTTYTDTTSHGMVVFMRLLPSLQRFVLSEANSSLLKVYGYNMALLGSIDLREQEALLAAEAARELQRRRFPGGGADTEATGAAKSSSSTTAVAPSLSGGGTATRIRVLCADLIPCWNLMVVSR
jgi:hypothetical protein